jgi:hypothetical protein
MMLGRLLISCAMLASFALASASPRAATETAKAGTAFGRNQNAFVGSHLHLHSTTAVASLRGGDVADATTGLSSSLNGFLSADNLAAFFGSEYIYVY